MNKQRLKVATLLRGEATSQNLLPGWSKKPDSLVKVVSGLLIDNKATKAELKEYFDSKVIVSSLQDRKYMLTLGVEEIKDHIQNIAHILEETLDEVDIEFEPNIHELTRYFTDIDVSLGHAERLLESWEGMTEHDEEVDLPDDDDKKDEKEDEDKKDGIEDIAIDKPPLEKDDPTRGPKSVAPSLADVPRETVSL